MQKIVELIELEKQYQLHAEATIAQAEKQLQEAVRTFQTERDTITKNLEDKDRLIADQVKQSTPPKSIQTPALPEVADLQKVLLSLIP